MLLLEIRKVQPMYSEPTTDKSQRSMYLLQTMYSLFQVSSLVILSVQMLLRSFQVKNLCIMDTITFLIFIMDLVLIPYELLHLAQARLLLLHTHEPMLIFKHILQLTRENLPSSTRLKLHIRELISPISLLSKKL
jgi:predicted membrane protein